MLKFVRSLKWSTIIKRSSISNIRRLSNFLISSWETSMLSIILKRRDLIRLNKRETSTKSSWMQKSTTWIIDGNKSSRNHSLWNLALFSLLKTIFKPSPSVLTRSLYCEATSHNVRNKTHYNYKRSPWLPRLSISGGQCSKTKCGCSFIQLSNSKNKTSKLRSREWKFYSRVSSPRTLAIRNEQQFLAAKKFRWVNLIFAY